MTDKAELLTMDDVWNDDGIMGANAVTGLTIHTMMPFVRAVEATILRKLAEQKPVGVTCTQAPMLVGGVYGGQVIPWTDSGVTKTAMMFKDLPVGTALYAAPVLKE